MRPYRRLKQDAQYCAIAKDEDETVKIVTIVKYILITWGIMFSIIVETANKKCYICS